MPSNFSSPIKAHVWVLTSFLLLCTSQSFACTVFRLNQPIRGSSIADVQPELRWGADPGSQSRVQISVVTPESRVLLSLDTVVQGNVYKFPNAVPSNFAAVKVLISQNCSQSDPQDLNAQGAIFFIDNTKGCAMKDAQQNQSERTLIWGKATDANEYIVRIFEVKVDADHSGSPVLLTTHKTSETRWELPSSVNLIKPGVSRTSALVASVQPICEGRAGIVQSFLLKPSNL
jgi:hypothetical protein